MPWINNVTQNNLIWLGEVNTIYYLDPGTAAINGIQVDFSLMNYSVVSYRYYKKLDWLLGIIGGAMLLFYIILWVPCNFVNGTLHRMRNANQLLLLNHSKEEEPWHESNFTAANVSNWYWLSNWLTNCLSTKLKQAHNLVQTAEMELDIVRLVKKMKVSERSITKKVGLPPFK
jgi:hypothetical protein